jgi:hypothetical protein
MSIRVGPGINADFFRELRGEAAQNVLRASAEQIGRQEVARRAGMFGQLVDQRAQRRGDADRHAEQLVRFVINRPILQNPACDSRCRVAAKQSHDLPFRG